MCGRDDTGAIWELPIYSERRWIGAFLTPNRLFRALMSLRHRIDRQGRSSRRAAPYSAAQRGRRLLANIGRASGGGEADDP